MKIIIEKNFSKKYKNNISEYSSRFCLFMYFSYERRYSRKYSLSLQRRKYYPYSWCTMMAGPIDLIFTLTRRYSESRKDLTWRWNQRRIETIWLYTRSYWVCQRAKITRHRCWDYQRVDFFGNHEKGYAYRSGGNFLKWSRRCSRVYHEISRSYSPYSHERDQRIIECRAKFSYFHASV